MLKCPKCFVVLRRVEINERIFGLCEETECNFITLCSGIKIEELHLLVGVDDDGNEAIPAYQSPEGELVPLIAIHPEQLAKLLKKIPYLKEAYTDVKLLKFQVREEVKFVNYRL